MPSWVQVFTDNFTRANGSVGNGWIDDVNAWSIASNLLTTSGTNLYYDFLERPASEYSGITDQQIVVYCVTSSTSGSLNNSTIIGLRLTGTVPSITGYVAWIGNNSSPTLYLGRLDPTSVSEGVQNLQNTAVSLTAGEAVILTLNANGSYIAVSVAAASAPGTILASLSFTDTTYTTGTMGVSAQTYQGPISSITTYQYGGPLSMGPLTLGTVDATGIVVDWPDAGGGTSPYAYALYRSLTTPFTPPGSGTLLYSGTALTYKDTSALAGVPVFYRVYATDSASGTALSSQTTVITSLCTEIKGLPLPFGFIGDSITAGYTSTVGGYPTTFASVIQSYFPERPVSVVNAAQFGTTTFDWLPTAPSNTYLATAVSSFHAAGVGDVFLMLGINDAKNGVSATSAPTTNSQYLANMGIICSYLTSAGFRVFVTAPTFIAIGASISYWTEAALSIILGYRAQIPSLLTSGKVLPGSQQLWELLQNNPADLNSDGIHPNDAGYTLIGQAQAIAYQTSTTTGGEGNMAYTWSGSYTTDGTITSLVVAAGAQSATGDLVANSTISVWEIVVKVVTTAAQTRLDQILHYALPDADGTDVVAQSLVVPQSLASVKTTVGPGTYYATLQVPATNFSKFRSQIVNKSKSSITVTVSRQSGS